MYYKYGELDLAIEGMDIKNVYKFYLGYLNWNTTIEELKKFMSNYFEKVSKIIDTDSSITKEELDHFWNRSEAIYEKIGASKRSFKQAYFKYIQRTGNWRKSLDSGSEWMTLEKDSMSATRVTEEIDRFIYYSLMDDYSNAFFILKETVEKCSEFQSGDKENIYISPLRFKLMHCEKDQVVKDLKIIERNIKINKESRYYLTEYVKTLSIIKPKKAIMALKYIESTKISYNDKIRFDLAIISENILSKLGGELCPRLRNELNECVAQGYSIQGEMNKRNQSINYTEEIIFWRKIRRSFGEVQKNSRKK